jgi:septum formation protein
MKLVLASASPRRAEILRNAGFAFEVFPTNVDESRFPGEGAKDYVLRLASSKARVAAEEIAKRGEQTIVIGADTVVVLGSQILGKPESAEDARWMLRSLSGQSHEVLTGISLLSTPENQRASHVETTRVSFLPLSEADIRDYLATNEPFDKAGAYGIQGIAGRYIPRIEGCYFNVMGLPVSRLWLMLRQFGWRESGSRKENH